MQGSIQRVKEMLAVSRHVVDDGGSLSFLLDDDMSANAATRGQAVVQIVPGDTQGSLGYMLVNPLPRKGVVVPPIVIDPALYDVAYTFAAPKGSDCGLKGNFLPGSWIAEKDESLIRHNLAVLLKDIGGLQLPEIKNLNDLCSPTADASAVDIGANTLNEYLLKHSNKDYLKTIVHGGPEFKNWAKMRHSVALLVNKSYKTAAISGSRPRVPEFQSAVPLDKQGFSKDTVYLDSNPDSLNFVKNWLIDELGADLVKDTAKGGIVVRNKALFPSLFQVAGSGSSVYATGDIFETLCDGKSFKAERDNYYGLLNLAATLNQDLVRPKNMRPATAPIELF